MTGHTHKLALKATPTCPYKVVEHISWDRVVGTIKELFSSHITVTFLCEGKGQGVR